MSTLSYTDVETAVSEELSSLGEIIESMVMAAGGSMKTIANKVFSAVRVVVKRTYKTSKQMISALAGAITAVLKRTLGAVGAIASMLGTISFKIANRLAKLIPVVVDRGMDVIRKGIEMANPADAIVKMVQTGDKMADVGLATGKKAAKAAGNMADEAVSAVEDLMGELRAWI